MSFKVLAGDFIAESKGSFLKHNETLFLSSEAQPERGEIIPIEQVELLDVATEDSVRRVGGTVGWGAVGGLALGPLGLLAGAALGGKGKDVTFVATISDGRRLLAKTDHKTFEAIRAAHFGAASKTDKREITPGSASITVISRVISVAAFLLFAYLLIRCAS